MLIVDDSPLFCEVLRDALERDGMQVVGDVGDGQRAIELVTRERPDVITMDLHMPGIDGLAAIEAIMSSRPTPILVLTADPRSADRAFAFEALSRGALELWAKPALGGADVAPVRELCRHLRLLSEVPVVHHPQRSWTPPKTAPRLRAAGHPPGIVGIVASTGGPVLLARTLAQLPTDFPLPIAVVQHLSSGFAAQLCRWLSRESALAVELAENGQGLRPGHVHVAPDGGNMRVTAAGTIALESPSGADFSPSGDHLLESLATAYGPLAVGVVLTGMGRDGARGLLAIRQRGGITCAQDADSSVVDGMPKAARESGAAQEVVADRELPAALLRYASQLGQRGRR